jgi:hypothetical protein
MVRRIGADDPLLEELTEALRRALRAPSAPSQLVDDLAIARAMVSAVTLQGPELSLEFAHIVRARSRAALVAWCRWRLSRWCGIVEHEGLGRAP